jgi:hypothetical protein
VSGTVSVITVDVKDDAWKAFKAAFDKHTQDLSGLPAAWGKLVKVQEKSLQVQGLMAQQFGLMHKAITTAGDQAAKAAEQQNKFLALTAASVTKMATGQDQFLKRVQSSSYAAEGLARHTASIARSMADATFSLVKWSALTGLAGGLLGGGGLWGLDRLGLAAGGARRSALGLGVTSGEQQAFGINFGRFVDPGSTLENIANAQNDVSKSWVFSSLGIRDWQGRDAASLAPDVLRRAKGLFDKNPTQQAADAYGLTSILSMDDLRRLHGTSYAELDKQAASYGRDRQGLAVSDPTQRAWQNFTQQLSLAGQTIENSLIKGLVALTDPLAHLTEHPVHMDWRSALFGTNGWKLGPLERENTAVGIAHDYFRQQGLSESQTAGFMGYFNEESGWKTDAWNKAGGGQGAQGIGQWRGERIDRFRAIFGHDPKDAPLGEQLQFAAWELQHTEKKAAQELAGTADPKSAADAVMKYYGRGSDAEYASRHGVAESAASGYFSKFAPTPATITYTPPPVNVNVKVISQTGSSAVVTAHSAAGGQ